MAGDGSSMTEENDRHFSLLKSSPIKGFFDRACETLRALKNYALIDLSKCEIRYADDVFVFRWEFAVLHVLAEADAEAVCYIVQTFAPPSIASSGNVASAINTLLKQSVLA